MVVMTVLQTGKDSARCLRLAPYVRCLLLMAVFRFLRVEIDSIERILLPL